jgi:hypothetical protein
MELEDSFDSAFHQGPLSKRYLAGSGWGGSLRATCHAFSVELLAGETMGHRRVTLEEISCAD